MAAGDFHRSEARRTCCLHNMGAALSPTPAGGRGPAGRGKGIHWYSKKCLDGAGDVSKRIADFEDGDFVWFTYTQSKDYGEAFVSETALRRIIGELGLPVEVTTEVTTFDSSSFVQDAFILRRLES